MMIVFFNREEDGFLGSAEFVAALDKSTNSIGEVHIFEMVGYRDRSPRSQRMPKGLPLSVAPTTGDFLALLSNSGSNVIGDGLLDLARTYMPDFPVLCLKVYLGLEKKFGDLIRSDHAPFWEAGIPALMWTGSSHSICCSSATRTRKSGRTIHWVKAELVAGFEMTSWTNDGVIRQASLQEVRERRDKGFRPDWINLPE